MDSVTKQDVAQNLELDFMQPVVKGNLKSGMKAIGASSGDLWAVDPFKIKVIENYNVRVRDELYEETVERLTESMMDPEVGFRKDSAISVIVVREDGKDVVYLKRGHRRLEAAQRAIKRGATFTHIYAIGQQIGLNDEDMIADLHHSNTCEKLRPFELAKLCKLYAIRGWDARRISTKLQLKSPGYVEDLLTYIEGPLVIRQYVEQGRITTGFAIERLKEYGNKAVEVIEKALAVAQSHGKKTAKPKHDSGAILKKAITKAAPKMRTVIIDVKADPGFQHLKPETQAMIEEIFTSLKEAEKTGDLTDIRDENQSSDPTDAPTIQKESE